ncbi:MAG: ligase-associated DNA damage response endonuclease PdeM [Chitinophagaceae bacterium]
MLNGQHLWLTTSRCIFWEERRSLILSDLHFGKTGHFRKAGIPVPAQVYQEDLQRLWSMIQYFQPEHIIFVGDLFHSKENLEHQLFEKWRNDHSRIKMHLVLGNHDILTMQVYEQMGLQCYPEIMQMESFSFIHDGSQQEKTSNFYFTGHIHPGIRLEGSGKQTMKFPCYYFTENYAVLPAFSKFTGMALIQPEKTDEVFAIVDTSIIRV